MDDTVMVVPGGPCAGLRLNRKPVTTPTGVWALAGAAAAIETRGMAAAGSPPNRASAATATLAGFRRRSNTVTRIWSVLVRTAAGILRWGRRASRRRVMTTSLP